MKSMEISVAESKHNDDEPFLDVGTFRCNPFEQLRVTLHVELQTHKVYFPTLMGKKILLMNMGLDKCYDGLMYSMLLCTRKNGNDSAVRRRPVAFADEPAIESTPNLESLNSFLF